MNSFASPGPAPFTLETDPTAVWGPDVGLTCEGVHKSGQRPVEHFEEGVSARVLLGAAQNGVLQDVRDAGAVHGGGAELHAAAGRATRRQRTPTHSFKCAIAPLRELILLTGASLTKPSANYNVRITDCSCILYCTELRT